MTIEQAIKKAIDGGYAVGSFALNYIDGEYNGKADIFLAPLFWQSLGKAMGWDNGYCRKCRKFITNIMNSCGCGEMFDPKNFQGEWEFEWHRFIDTLAEGKTAEEFFENLPQ